MKFRVNSALVLLLFTLFSIISLAQTKIEAIVAASDFDTANAEFKNGNYKLAIDYYTKAINNDSSIPVYYEGRGDAYVKFENYREAISDYDNYIQKCEALPRNISSTADQKTRERFVKNIDCINESLRSNLKKDSVTEFTTSLESTSRIAIGEVYNKKGLAEEKLGNKTESCGDFKKASEYGTGYYYKKNCDSQIRSDVTNGENPKPEKSSSMNLIETRWAATVIIEEKETGDTLELLFDYAFGENGESAIAIYSTRRGYWHEYETTAYERRLVMKYGVKSRFSSTEKGKYKVDGNTIHLEYPSQKVDAKVSGNFAEGTIFLPDWGKKDGVIWKAEKQSK